MDNYTLSVIVPAYNCESTISQTLDSLLSQKSKDMEIIIINDGSTDSTEAICQKYCSENINIKYFYKDNSGVSETRNLGIKKSTGKYIAFLDSDDVWDSEYYDEELNEDLKQKDCDIFVFSSCFSDMNLNVQEYVKVKNELLIDYKDKAVDKYYHHFSSFIFKNEFLKVNNLKFNPSLRYGEDELFRSQCLYLSHSIYAKDKLSFYYRNNINSATKLNRKHRLFAEQKLKAYYLMKDFFFGEYEKEGKEKVIRNSRTVAYFSQAIKLLSEIGYGYKNIKNICEAENVRVFLKNCEKYYDLYYIEKDNLEGYIKSPFLFYVKNRFHGLWYYPALKVKRMISALRRK